MPSLEFEKGITALIVIDPYNDFISEGGKVWDRLNAIAEANQCVPPTWCKFSMLPDGRESAYSMRFTADIVPATTRRGSMLRQSRGQPGTERLSNTAHGAVRSDQSSNPSPATSWLQSIGVRVVSPTRIWICSLRNTAFTSSSSPSSSHTPAWRPRFATPPSSDMRSP